jgi:hypothetical protein
LVSNAVIANNFIYSNGQNAINADGLQNSVIENNLIYAYKNYGICLYRTDASGPSKDNVIVNNTITSSLTGAGAAVRILNSGTGNTLLNNILLGGANITLRISANSLPGLVSDYNVVRNLFQSEDTSATQSFAQWQAQMGQDLDSFIAIPADLFVDVAGNDYHLSATSPAIGAGTSNQAPALDLDGNPRPSDNGWDIGAYEYYGGTRRGAESAAFVAEIKAAPDSVPDSALFGSSSDSTAAKRLVDATFLWLAGEHDEAASSLQHVLIPSPPAGQPLPLDALLTSGDPLDVLDSQN